MPRSAASLIALLTIPLILLLLATAFLAWRSSVDLDESHRMVGSSNRIYDEIQEVLIQAQNAETGQRGFVLTGNETYLKPFTDAVAQMPLTLQHLTTDVAESSEQKARLKELEGYLDLKMGEMADTVELRRQQGLEAALHRVSDNSGQAAMNSIRSIVHDMSLAERTLLEQRLAASRMAERRIFIVTGILFVILLAVCAVAGLVLRSSFKRMTMAEAELENKARLLQTTLDTIAEGIAAFDAAGRIVAYNPGFFAQFGFPPEIAEEQPSLARLEGFDGAETEGFQVACNLEATQSKSAHAVFERNKRSLDIHRSLMPNGGTVFTVRDITDSRNAESTLRHAQKMETVGQLTGGIAHDFNNLLQIILTNLDFAVRDVTNPDLRRRLQSAIVAAERGSKLTRQLLAFARRQPLKAEPVNLGRMVRDLTELLRRTLGETIEIEEVVAAGLWTAMADRSQVENAIVNLAINARDAMPNGGKLTIELGNTFLDDAYAAQHEEVQAGQYVMLAVTDTGTGMTQEVISRAFDPFFSTKPEGRGTGLGLSMVYGFVKQSGGHAKIYSELGVGTSVRLYLPRSMQAETVVAIQSRETLSGQGETILVVEDEVDVRVAVIFLLRDLGYRTLEAGNGEEALAVLESDAEIDLMFTDVVMPGEIQGRILAQRAERIRPGLKIVFTSGYTENSIIHHGRLDDGVHLLSKPYRREDLARKLRGVLGAPDPTRMVLPPVATEPAPPEPLPLVADIVPDRIVAQGGPRRIVFAEDDALVAMSTVDMLEMLEYEVSAAADEKTALELISSINPRVLLVDVNLGGGDGRKLAQQACKLSPELKVVFATGRDPGDLQEYVPGALVLNKPYGLAELKEALETVFPSA